MLKPNSFVLQNPEVAPSTRVLRSRQKMEKVKKPNGSYFQTQEIENLNEIQVPQTSGRIDNDGFSSAGEDLIPDISDEDEIPDIDTPPSEHVSIYSSSFHDFFLFDIFL